VISDASFATAYIGIGSNLRDPASQVRRAFRGLALIPESRLRACSPLYLTVPVGIQQQPDYVNAAACVETALSAQALLSQLQLIERRQGRVRDGTRWGPRILDLDLLVFGDFVIDQPGLQVPHPELAKRAFVLVPLSDIAPPALEIPGQGALTRLLAGVSRAGVLRLESQSPAGCPSAAQLAESSDAYQE
jgi:2-amino-4-hydroxy-6-hydroxymethyldihydropteridine diphosphokinase